MNEMMMKTIQRTLYYAICFISSLLMVMMGACTSDSDVKTPDEVKPVAVTFDTYLQQSQTMRTIFPSGYKAQMTLADLQASGFGVFAHHSDATTFDRTSTVPYNFMFNQLVEWDSGNSRWTYSPVKYWPNDNNPADNNGATGSQTHSYLSFFAYAPYITYQAIGVAADEGIMGMTTDNTTKVGETYITYRTSKILGGGADLLWAGHSNLYKTKDSGEGTTEGHVRFLFKHALSRLNITVQGVFDEMAPSGGTYDGYSDDVDANTRILIESVEIKQPVLAKESRLYLAPNPNGVDVPYWVKQSDLDGSFTNTLLDSRFLYTALTDHADAESALADFEALPAGVDKQERFLFAGGGAGRFYMFPPTSETRSLKVKIVYYTITYDPRLTLNNPKYFSIVRNEIEATSTANFDFEANKQYNFRLLLGMTTAKFKVDAVDEWGTGDTKTIDLPLNVKVSTP